jgi:hypothetical protein
VENSAVTKFVQSLDVRRGHCRALLELARRQHGLVVQAQYGPLLELLQHKQHVLDRLSEVSRSQSALNGGWPQLREQAGDAVQARVEQLMDEVEHLLKEVAEQESQALADLQTQRDETARQIAELSQGTQVQRAYADSLAPATHRRLDVQH